MRAQKDLRIIKKKNDQQDWKSRRKFVQNASKWSNDRFGKNIWPTVGQIFGTKCDRDKQIFFQQKKVVNMIEFGIQKGPNVSENVKKWGQLRGSSLSPLIMGVLSLVLTPFYLLCKLELNCSS